MKQLVYIDAEWLESHFANDARIKYFRDNIVDFSVHLVGSPPTAMGVPLGEDIPVYAEIFTEFANGDRIQFNRPIKNHEKPFPEVIEFVLDTFSKIPIWG